LRELFKGHVDAASLELVVQNFAYGFFAHSELHAPRELDEDLAGLA
jgi:hypothetical protein